MLSKAEMAELYAKINLPRRIVDLRAILSWLKSEMHPLAQYKECWFDLFLPVKSVKCKIWEAGIQIALRNLIDNAIKYSFDRQPIRIVLKSLYKTTAEISIYNYGIGIPENRKQDIFKVGERGHVKDPKRSKRSRPGTGLGIPIAIEHLHAHGGSFDIQCIPPFDKNESGKIYRIRVLVTLPLAKEFGYEKRT